MIRAYHFVNATLRDGSAIPANGEWLTFEGKLSICKRGLHASKHVADALTYAPGTTLCLVDIDGDMVEQEDKVCAAKRRIVARFDATELLRADARASALSVIHLWKAPAIVRQYLESGDESIRVEARDAAAAAAYAADAAYAAAAAASAAAAAACAAAPDAAYAYDAYAAAAYAADGAPDAYVAKSKHRQASRDRLAAAVDAKFKELMS
jgi:hypothetical protein